MSSVGQGSLSVSQKAAAGGGPPFPGNAADNGLSVDPITGRIVLGSDFANLVDAQLLSDRFIDMNAFSFNMVDNVGSAFLSVQPANGTIFIGIPPPGNSTYFTIDDTQNLLSFESSLRRIMELSNTGSVLAAIGDINGLGNFTRFTVDDGGAVIQSQTNRFTVFDLVGQSLDLDMISFLYSIGDISGGQNGTRLAVDDTGNAIVIQNTAMNAVVNMNGVAGFTGTVAAPASITVNGGIVTAVS